MIFILSLTLTKVRSHRMSECICIQRAQEGEGLMSRAVRFEEALWVPCLWTGSVGTMLRVLLPEGL